jgi:endo-1,4-beta-D-glucanase Y
MTRLLLLSLVVVAAPLARAADLRPFPQHVAYASGTIRPSHQTQAQQDAAVRAYYDQWKADFLTTDGTGNPSHWRVRFGKTAPDSAITVSEGQGFGMVIVAIMAGYDAAAQTIFDGLWGFTRANPSIIDARLMGWKIPPDEPGGSDSAFDGDCDMAYGLLLDEEV